MDTFEEESHNAGTSTSNFLCFGSTLLADDFRRNDKAVKISQIEDMLRQGLPDTEDDENDEVCTDVYENFM